VLATLIIFTLLYAVNATLPMAVPDAQGKTTAQLYADRLKVMVLENKDGYPLNLHPTLVLFPAGYFVSPFELVICELYPDSKFDKWVKKVMVNNTQAIPLRPRVEAKWLIYQK